MDRPLSAPAVYFRDGLVSLVAMEESDVPRVAGWINDERIGWFNGARFPVSLAEQAAWFRNVQGDRSKNKLLIASPEGERVGMVSLFRIDPRNQNAEIGVYVAPEHQGRGYARAALRLMLNFAFRELNLHRVYCTILAYNAASLALFERLGFREEGRRREHVFAGGAFVDEVLMSVLRRDWP
jgi:RimJ/RimL family protein N-acetyltransferase